MGKKGVYTLRIQKNSSVRPPPTLWFADSGGSKSMTSDSMLMYTMRAPSAGNSRAISADGTTLKSGWMWGLGSACTHRLMFLVRMASALVVGDLNLNLFSLHWGQRNGGIILDEQGAHFWYGESASPTMTLERTCTPLARHTIPLLLLQSLS